MKRILDPMGMTLPCAPSRRFDRFRITAGTALLAWTLMAAGTPAPAQEAPDQQVAAYSTAQLDQMLAPIALYPDELLGQILMATSYPLEVVEADRWLQDPANASLRGMQLAYALEQQPWDASVKSLAAFPQILGVLDNNIEWTEELGEAFIAQQAEVMDRVQQLRSRAEAARTLITTPQQTVANNDQAIEIAPAAPDTVYVPVYDPNVVYGGWPYPDNQPFDFDMPGYAPGAYIGYVIVVPLWGWTQWDWHHHWLGVDGGPGSHGGPGGAGGAGRPSGAPPGRPHRPLHPVPWRHDPTHRGDVPYRNSAIPTPSAGGTRPVPGEFRGYAPARIPAAPPGAAVPGAALRSKPGIQPGIAPGIPPRLQEPRVQEPRIAEPRITPGPVIRPAPPAMESYGHGPQVRVQEERGASSRESAPSPSSHGNEHK
jgi:hypothetical protein